MYREGTDLDVKEYNFLCHQSGLGDMIGRLPAIKYVLDHHPQIVIHLYVHDYAVTLCQKALPYPNLTVTGLSDAKGKFDESLPTRSADLHNIKNLSCHITDHAFLTLVHKGVEDKYKNYIKLNPIDVSKFNLPEKYVVITTGFTSETREWKAEYVNGFTDYLVSKSITPVYIGKSYTQAAPNVGITGNFNCSMSNGINLVDRTDLLEAHSICSGAIAVVGLDNGLCPHLAAMSDVPIIVGFTTVEPKDRLPYRSGILGKDCYVVYPDKKELGCIGCQSNCTFTAGHSFTKCMYDDYKCLSLMTTDKWIEQFEKLALSEMVKLNQEMGLE